MHAAESGVSTQNPGQCVLWRYSNKLKICISVKTPADCCGAKVSLMLEGTDSETFEEIVEWAYSTLPQEIRELPDFPGIQVADEPTEYILNGRNWPKGREMLGCYSGILRTEPQHFLMRTAPDFNICFSGPDSAVFKRRFASRSETGCLA